MINEYIKYYDGDSGAPTGQITGYFRKDCFGRFFVDTCKTDEEHLTAPAIEGKERRSCRFYLDDLFNKLDSKQGGLFFEMQFIENTNEPNT